MELSLNQEQLKSLIKAALVEVLEERQDLLHDALEDAIEDVWPSFVPFRKVRTLNSQVVKRFQNLQ